MKTLTPSSLPADLRRRALLVLSLAALGLALAAAFRFASYALWPLRPLSRGLARRASNLSAVVRTTLDVVRTTLEAQGVRV